MLFGFVWLVWLSVALGGFLWLPLISLAPVNFSGSRSSHIGTFSESGPWSLELGDGILIFWRTLWMCYLLLNDLRSHGFGIKW